MSLRWVLVDSSSLAYRAYHAMGGLESEDVPTGVAYGFLRGLRAICLHPRVRSNRVVICCDAGHSVRRLSYPAYKSKRRPKSPGDQERLQLVYQQLRLLESEVLPDIGVPVYRQDGLEGDDILAQVAKQVRRRGESAVVVGADKDLLQCVRGRVVTWLDPQRHKWYDEGAFRQEYGVHPRAWAGVKAVAGCSTDQVAGVPGVGELTALRYVRGELPPGSRSYQMITSPEGQAVAARNLPLVQLPHEVTARVELREPDWQPRAFFRWCRKLGFKSILRERVAWEAWMLGTPFREARERGKS